MELFGKILVFVTLGLSLLAAAIGGLALYNRVDWSNNKPPPDQPDQPAGELVGRIDRLMKAQANLAPADRAWSAARAALPPAEAFRKTDAGWYADELDHLRTNPNRKPIQAVQLLSAGADAASNQPPRAMTPTAMVPVNDRYGQPLQSRTEYAAQIADMDGKVLAAFEKLMTSTEDDTRLTIRLIGPAGEAPDGVAGVIAKVDEQIMALAPKPDDDKDTQTYKEKLIGQLNAYKKQLEELKGPTIFARGLDKRIQDEQTKLEGIIGQGGLMEAVQANGKTVWKVKARPDGWRPKDGEMALVESARVQELAESELLRNRQKQLQALKQRLLKPAAAAPMP